jgi:hypothetical protein
MPLELYCQPDLADRVNVIAVYAAVLCTKGI